jgi:uncharacterized protein YdcH (DUF465 family)|tara:strand:+ start:183 stop:317 length:135 start_codon:yes stop_codon:yes gene_type:complete
MNYLTDEIRDAENNNASNKEIDFLNKLKDEIESELQEEEKSIKH